MSPHDRRVLPSRIVILCVLGWLALVLALTTSARATPAGQVPSPDSLAAAGGLRRLPRHTAQRPAGLPNTCRRHPPSTVRGSSRAHRRRTKDTDMLLTSIDVGFNMHLVAQRAQELSSRSWELGTTAELLLELYTPRLSAFNVFSQDNVPQGTSISSTPALAYIAHKIFTNNSATLTDGAGSSGDPCSLGVSAILLAYSAANSSYPSPQAYKSAYRRQIHHLLTDVPRYQSGALSSREQGLEMWADFAVRLARLYDLHGPVDKGMADLLRRRAVYGLPVHGILWRSSQQSHTAARDSQAATLV